MRKKIAYLIFILSIIFFIFNYFLTISNMIKENIMDTDALDHFIIRNMLLPLSFTFFVLTFSTKIQKKYRTLILLFCISLVVYNYATYRELVFVNYKLLNMFAVYILVLSYMPLYFIDRLNTFRNFGSKKSSLILLVFIEIVSTLIIGIGLLFATSTGFSIMSLQFIAIGLTTYALVGLVWNKKFDREVHQRISAEKEIFRQHEELTEVHREIRDSINYAKRIQSAILPPESLVKKHLPNSFILYKPKDVVAGDFYWLEQKGNKVFFAAADCTGHGVPGAMVSVICNNALNRSVREHNINDVGKILDKSREIVIQEFEKSDEEVQDGMDLALCSLEGNTLQYAGANNPLWIIRNGEIIETKADKQAIGKSDHQNAFTTHTFELKKGDTIYIFSDGYVDQFGGERGKKFKASALRNLLLTIQAKTMAEQKNVLDESFENWRGTIEQVDDVCMIGLRV